ncbi:MAG: hypothetical protein U0Q22_04020 [Acidimicrobiales bacterium]
MANLAAAYELATDCADSYSRAGSSRRRLLNQTFFARIKVYADPFTREPSIAEVKLEPVFKHILDHARRDSPAVSGDSSSDVRTGFKPRCLRPQFE